MSKHTKFESVLKYVALPKLALPEQIEEELDEDGDIDEEHEEMHNEQNGTGFNDAQVRGEGMSDQNKRVYQSIAAGGRGLNK